VTWDARLCFLGDLRAYLIGILYRTALSRIQDDLSSSFVTDDALFFGYSSGSTHSVSSSFS